MGSVFEEAVQSLQKTHQRMVRVQVEELVLKRCWLARYWGLAARLGVYPDVAHTKHAVWAKLAPLPLEVVLSAGQKGKDYSADSKRRLEAETVKDSCPESSEEVVLDQAEKESMLAVEKGLREMAEMRLEEAVLLKISHNQNPALIWLGLSKEEAQDIRFKKAWLVYFWRRALLCGVEADIATERLLYWENRNSKNPTYDDAVDVETGLLELESLRIEEQLHEISHENVTFSSGASSETPDPVQK